MNAKRKIHHDEDYNAFIMYRGSMYRNQLALSMFYRGGMSESGFSGLLKRERAAGLPFLDAGECIFTDGEGEEIRLPGISYWYDRDLYVRWHNSESFGPAPVCERPDEGAVLYFGNKKYAFRTCERKA